MNRIKFGTDGWRAVIARDFTETNLLRLSLACSLWLFKKYKDPRVIVSYDCRFGGPMFAETVSKIMASRGVNVILSDRFTSTPVLSMGVRNYSCHMGIMITASHNPFDYNGFKLKTSAGGPFSDDDTRDIENLIDYENEVDLSLIKMEDLLKRKMIRILNIEDPYLDAIKAEFNFSLLSKSSHKIVVDPMYGSGQNVLPALFPKIRSLHDKQDYSFNYTAPEPLEKNLSEIKDYISQRKTIKMGICLDGDADRIALIDEKGNYIDSHRIILLLIHYLAGYKNQTGKIVTGFSSTIKIEKLAQHYNLPVRRVKIGFKQISGYMQTEDVLVGGEESGGISIKGHIPERDGIWMALLIWQWMEESGKSLSELLDEVYGITGNFTFVRSDLTVDKELRALIMNNCENEKYRAFGSYNVLRTENLDGYKFILDDSSWLMIRPSGTEPVLRTYAEAENFEKAKDIIDSVRKVIMTSG